LKLIESQDTIQIALLVTILIASIIPVSVIYSQASNTISSVGYIAPTIDISVNSSKVICINNLSLGFMLHGEWKSWRDSSIRRGLARDANFKLIRFFSHRVEPCTYWNESTKTGVFNWTDVDLLVQRIFEIGAEPLVTIGFYSRTENSMLGPQGMANNSATGLPYPESWAVYCAEWVKHFEKVGLPVRFYEIVNEPDLYFGFVDRTKLSHFVELWNTAARSMRVINDSILLSHCAIMFTHVMDYWLQNGDDVDFLSFHKYDCWVTSGSGYHDDATILARAELRYFDFVGDARKRWFKARGKLLPLINSESNLNSAYDGGADPRIQQIVGAVWTALVLRMGILEGLSYNVYYSFSSASYGKTSPTGGAGFGMVNSINNQPWYPYYVHYMLGNNLVAGDSIVNVTSSSDDIRSIAWVHGRTLNILLICKVDQRRIVYLHGVEGELNMSKVDNTIPWETPSVQTDAISSTDLLIINGYTVALLQTSAHS